MTRPCKRTRIVNLLHMSDEPLLAVDIGLKLNFTTHETSQLLKFLVSKGSVCVQKPQHHLGQRFSSLYWFKVVDSFE